jgi:hypothetical protein
MPFGAMYFPVAILSLFVKSGLDFQNKLNSKLYMGGPIEKGQLANFSWELPIRQVRFELKSNVVPIDKIKSGIHIHRALLFKVCII